MASKSTLADLLVLTLMNEAQMMNVMQIFILNDEKLSFDSKDKIRELLQTHIDASIKAVKSFCEQEETDNGVSE